MATYFVRPVNGSDAGGAADGLTFANAFKTSQKAADAATSDGDEIRLCNEADELPTSTVDWDATSAIIVEIVAGDSTDGTPLTTGFYILDGASGSGDLCDFTATASTYVFQRIRFTGGKAHNLDMHGNVAIALQDCRVDNAVTNGVLLDSSSSLLTLTDTEVDNNGGWGITQTTNSRAKLIKSGGSVHDNGSGGVNTGAGVLTLDTAEIYANTGVGVEAHGGEFLSILNSTIHSNTSDGVVINGAASYPIIRNTTFTENGGYAINDAAGAILEEANLVDYNHYDDNTLGDTNLSATPGENNISGDPKFTNTTPGSEDFIPLNTSPLIRAGVSGTTIGARHEQDPAGGGSASILGYNGLRGGLQ